MSWNGEAKSKEVNQTDAELEYEEHLFFPYLLLFFRRCCQLCIFRPKYIEEILSLLDSPKQCYWEGEFFSKLLLRDFLTTPLFSLLSSPSFS